MKEDNAYDNNFLRAMKPYCNCTEFLQFPPGSFKLFSLIQHSQEIPESKFKNELNNQKHTDIIVK